MTRSYNMQKEKTYNLLMVIPDDRTMKGYKAPANSAEVRAAYKGWSSMYVLSKSHLQAALVFSSIMHYPKHSKTCAIIDADPRAHRFTASRSSSPSSPTRSRSGA